MADLDNTAEQERERLSNPDYVKKEGDRIMKALRETQPSFMTKPPGAVTIAPASGLLEGRFGASGSDWAQSRFNQGPPTRTRADIFTPPDAAATQSAQAADVPKIAFIVSDATVTEGDPPVESNKVLVADGKINGELPTGMGTGDYTLDLADPSDSLIYAGVTFNPTTLAITSRFLGVSTAAGYPESRVESSTEGFLYWLLAFTYFDGDGVFQVVNARVGNINYAITYGANGSPARPHMLPVDSEPGWLDLDAIFPP